MAVEQGASPNIVTTLAIVIVNYNSTDFLLRCLDTVKRFSAGIDVKTVVIDNASEEEQCSRLPASSDALQIIRNSRNAGFSKACNQGIATYDAKYYLLLNPDLELHPSTLENCLAFMEQHPDAGIVGCRVLNPDGSLQLASRRSIPTIATSFYRLTGLSLIFPKSPRFAGYNLTYLDENRDHDVEAVSGSFLLFRRDILLQVRGLDEDFFLYGEDLDFCLRTTQAGWKVFYFAGASVTHHKSRSADRNSSAAMFHYWNAMRIFYLKHDGRTDGFLKRTTVLAGIRAMYWLKRLRFGLFRGERVASRR